MGGDTVINVLIKGNTETAGPDHFYTHLSSTHTEIWEQECLLWGESRDKFTKETISYPGEC